MARLMCIALLVVSPATGFMLPSSPTGIAVHRAADPLSAPFMVARGKVLRKYPGPKYQAIKAPGNNEVVKITGEIVTGESGLFKGGDNTLLVCTVLWLGLMAHLIGLF